jgi:hypothetical protein
MFILTTDFLLVTATLTNGCPIPSLDRAPHVDKTITVTEKLIFVHESQGRQTVCQSQHDFKSAGNDVSLRVDFPLFGNLKTLDENRYSATTDEG